MSHKRKNAGEGYGYMFSGAFAKKADAVKKEKQRKGSFVKAVMMKSGMRYAVMTPRTNPIKHKKKAERGNPHTSQIFDTSTVEGLKKAERFKAKLEKTYDSVNVYSIGLNRVQIVGLGSRAAIKRHREGENPSELLVMAANPSESRELTVPAGSTITIRVNPEPRPNAFAPTFARLAIEERARKQREAAYERQQKARAKASRADEERMTDYYSKLRKKVRQGPRKVRDLFHELYAPLEENPVCGVRIGGQLCTRNPGHRGPHLPQGATMRTAKRLPHSWKPRKRNPSAATLREEFTGSPADWITAEQEPHIPAGDYAQLGELLSLYVKPGRGDAVQQINFREAERPLLLSDESARQLWLAGGNQDVSASLSAFGANGDSELVELGELRRIDYKQRKEHVPHPDHDEWRHEMGEESGVRPRLWFDTRLKRLLVQGGEYEVRPEGIVN